VALSIPIISSACSLVRSFDSRRCLDIDILSCADMSLGKDITGSFKGRMTQNHKDMDERFGASGGPDVAHDGEEQTVSGGEGYLPVLP